MKNKKALIVGGGIAGLCCGIYLQKNGFEAEIIEMHSIPGGLATAWKRDGYTFENCIHWLLGSKDGEDLNSTWKEVFDIERLDFYNDPVYQVIEKGSARIVIYRDVERMQQELLAKAPEDAGAIREFAGIVRKLSSMKMPGGDHLSTRLISNLKILPYLWLLGKHSKLTMADYANKFNNPLLKLFFETGIKELSFLAIAFSLAWMSKGNAGYPVGGSLRLIGLTEEQFKNLGGNVRFNARAERIIVQNDTATGVVLQGGEKVAGDIVVSAADAHATIFHLLQGKYLSGKFAEVFENYRPFPSYVQVSIGVGADLKEEPGFLGIALDEGIEIDPLTRTDFLSFRIFNFDPTFAPPGKTAVVSFITTHNYEHWTSLREANRGKYDKEKQRIADSVLRIFQERVPAAKGNIEVVDVATPATVIRYTGNWKGSMEGWLYTPETGIQALPPVLPKLKNFYMAGQWLSPGGGLPSGIMTARNAVRRICRDNRVKFKA
jgi:phytoene dehydrogenase-like protein